jgi:hypothetical protein
LAAYTPLVPLSKWFHEFYKLTSDWAQWEAAAAVLATTGNRIFFHSADRPIAADRPDMALTAKGWRSDSRFDAIYRSTLSDDFAGRRLGSTVWRIEGDRAVAVKATKR